MLPSLYNFSILSPKDLSTRDIISVKTLIDAIVTEREEIGNNLEKKLNNLIWLNERLIQFEKEPQTSKTQALKLLRTISLPIVNSD